MLQILVQHLVCGGKQTIAITIFNILLMTILMCFTLKSYSSLKNTKITSIALILGGGIGNLIDRLFRGHVIDYIDINKFITYPLFNLADICIVLGVILIFLSLIIEIIKKQEKE